jgi:hypothetical protein
MGERRRGSSPHPRDRAPGRSRHVRPPRVAIRTPRSSSTAHGRPRILRKDQILRSGISAAVQAKPRGHLRDEGGVGVRLGYRQRPVPSSRSPSSRTGSSPPASATSRIGTLTPCGPSTTTFVELGYAEAKSNFESVDDGADVGMPAAPGRSGWHGEKPMKAGCRASSAGFNRVRFQGCISIPEGYPWRLLVH